MARAANAARLTEAHRLAQARLGAVTVRQLRTIWPLLDPQELDATFHRWTLAAGRVVQAQRQVSAGLAANYMNVFRSLEVDGAFVPTLEGPVSADALATSLLVTGPIQIRRALGNGVPLARAVDMAAATSARAGMRHALDGGRRTIERTVHSDKAALGFARATSGKACAFCAMLASRGPVYKTERGAEFHAHDGCHCTIEPVYHRGAEWPDGARQYAQLWKEATRGLSGDDARNAFRHAIETAA